MFASKKTYLRFCRIYKLISCHVSFSNYIFYTYQFLNFYWTCAGNASKKIFRQWRINFRIIFYKKINVIATKISLTVKPIDRFCHIVKLSIKNMFVPYHKHLLDAWSGEYLKSIVLAVHFHLKWLCLPRVMANFTRKYNFLPWIIYTESIPKFIEFLVTLWIYKRMNHMLIRVIKMENCLLCWRDNWIW